MRLPKCLLLEAQRKREFWNQMTSSQRRKQFQVVKRYHITFQWKVDKSSKAILVSRLKSEVVNGDIYEIIFLT